MKRIYVIVEGPTEREFVTRVLAPYFGEAGLSISAIPMLKSGGGMGFSNLDHFKNNIEPLLHEHDQPIITTMVDLYRFPMQSGDQKEETALKEYGSNPDIALRLAGLEDLLSAVVQKIKTYPYFIPYIQKYEFEALLFSDPDVFELEDRRIPKDIEAVLKEYPNPEDINTTETGHPAKRLETIFATHKRKYSKGADAVDFAELAGIEMIFEKCPRFRSWIETLIAQAQKH